MNYVLFTYEANFNKNGMVNSHYLHYYANTKPYFIRTNSQTRWSLNSWGDIIGNYAIGPYFFDGRGTVRIYFNYLQNELPRKNVVFTYGAPVHHTAQIHEYLNNEFPETTIGRGGPVQWPPRSPDLIKIDFFLWGYVKNEVFKITPTTKYDMKERTTTVFRNINNIVLNSVSDSFEKRINSCLNVNGNHIEHLFFNIT
ncbi:hypothetical protein D910_04181, partial [Dendroctonus ponderosae]